MLSLMKIYRLKICFLYKYAQFPAILNKKAAYFIINRFFSSPDGNRTHI